MEPLIEKVELLTDELVLCLIMLGTISIGFAISKLPVGVFAIID